MIFGAALISLSMLVGNLLGNLLGQLTGIHQNIGGVGFSMICLLLASRFLKQRNRFSVPTERGVQFWQGMYIPIVIAMSASQDAVSAVSQGLVAIVAGVVPVLLVFAVMLALSKRADSKE